MAVGVLGNHHDVGDRLTPRQLVRVVLERPHEHHGALTVRDVRREPVPVVERRGEAQAEDPDQLVDRSRRAGAAEDHTRPVVAADCLAHDPPCVLAQACRLQARAGGLRVGVGVARQHLVADHVLDEPERPSARRVVGVGDATRPERAPHDLVVADHRLADALEEWAVRRGAHPGRVAPGGTRGASESALVGEYQAGRVGDDDGLGSVG